MPPDTGFKIALELEDAGGTRALRCEGDSVLIGSASHCDVRLPPDQAAPEQLRLELDADGGVRAKLLAREPVTLLAGETFDGGALAQGALLAIGAQRLRVSSERVATTHAAPSLARVRRLAIAVLAILAVFALVRGSRARPEREPLPEAPPLWQPGPEARCPEAAPDAMRAAAAELLAEAGAKHERAPFAPHEGLAAAPLYENAAVCLAALGEQRDVERVLGRVRTLRERLTRDYHLQQVRLLRALATDDSAAARRQALLLRRYLGQRPSEYATFLERLLRKLELEARAKEET